MSRRDVGSTKSAFIERKKFHGLNTTTTENIVAAALIKDSSSVEAQETLINSWYDPVRHLFTILFPVFAIL